MEFKKRYLVGIGLGLIVIIISLFFMKNMNLFFFLAGIAIIIMASPFVLSTIHQTSVDNEKEEMFLEFARDLVEGVKAGTPISKSIMNIRNKPYGVLSGHIKKLANQISLGIPFGKAIEIFSRDVNNKSISRTLTLIGQAEKAGGDIGEILESVAGAVNMSNKLKKERMAAISTLVVQGYIIFFVFIIIILVLQFKILPMLSGITEIGAIGQVNDLNIGVNLSTSADSQSLSNAFLYLLLVQGLFSGLTIGKLAEGNIKAGIKHSFALIIISFLISTGANLIF
jgi:flagellar protein FlaJ